MIILSSLFYYFYVASKYILRYAEHVNIAWKYIRIDLNFLQTSLLLEKKSFWIFGTEPNAKIFGASWTAVQLFDPLK